MERESFFLTCPPVGKIQGFQGPSELRLPRLPQTHTYTTHAAVEKVETCVISLGFDSERRVAAQSSSIGSVFDY